MKMLLGLAGYAKAGKSTLANSLENYTRLSFATVLKQEVALMLQAIGFDADFNDPEQKEEYRDLLVFWGAFKRKQDPDHWIKQLYMRNSKLFEQDHRIVIDDVRYENEAKWIQNRAGVVVYVQRDGVEAANEEEWNSINKLKTIGGKLYFIENNECVYTGQKLLREIMLSNLTEKL